MALADSFRGFIFDFGGVLVEHQTADDQAQMASVAGIPVNKLHDLYWSLRLDYDRGDLTGPDYWNAIARQAGTTLSTQQIQQLADLDSKSWMRFDDPMWDWVAQLRGEGKRVAMLSNMPQPLGDALKLETERLNRFDQVTLSYEVRSVKPDPVIYEHCLEALGTAPEQTLFLDDRIENIQAAEALGIRAIQFLNRDDVLLKLRQ